MVTRQFPRQRIVLNWVYSHDLFIQLPHHNTMLFSCAVNHPPVRELFMSIAASHSHQTSLFLTISRSYNILLISVTYKSWIQYISSIQNIGFWFYLFFLSFLKFLYEQNSLVTYCMRNAIVMCGDNLCVLSTHFMKFGYLSHVI